MIIILAVVVLIKKEINWKRIRKDMFFYPVIMILLASTIAVVVAGVKYPLGSDLSVAPLIKALGIWKAYFVEPIIFYWLALSLITVRRHLEGLFWALGASVVYLGLFGFWQYFSGYGVPQAFMNDSGGVDRIVSVFGYPNAIGLYMGPILVIFLGFLFYRNPDSLLLYFNNTSRFWLKLAVVVIAVLSLFLAQSEGAIAGVAVATGLLMLVNKKSRAILLLILAIGAIIFFTHPEIRDLIITKLTMSDYSSLVRRLMWQETFTMLKDNWFWGIGLASFPTAFAGYHKFRFEIFPYPHNELLNVWSELGLLGVISFGWLALCFVKTNVKNIFHIVAQSAGKLPFDKVASFTFLLAGLEIVIHGLVDAPYFKNDLAIVFWILIASASLNCSLRDKGRPDCREPIKK
jgi:O-antigen ligase